MGGTFKPLQSQLEMLFHWKRIGDNYNEDELSMLIDYINAKIAPHTLNKNGERKIKNAMKKNKLTDIFDVIDSAFESSIKYEYDQITHSSCEEFINNIPKYLTVKSKGPIEQKILYIRGICRNAFRYCDDRKAYLYMKGFVDALRDAGRTDDEIMSYLTDQLEPETKKSKNWSEWHRMVNSWTSQVKQWERREVQEIPVRSLSDEMACSLAYDYCQEVLTKLELFAYIQKAYPQSEHEKYNKLEHDVCEGLYNFLVEQKKLFLKHQAKVPQEVEKLINQGYTAFRSNDYFDLEDGDIDENCALSFGARYHFTYEIFDLLIRDLFYTLNFAHRRFDMLSTITCIDVSLQFFSERINGKEGK